MGKRFHRQAAVALIAVMAVTLGVMIYPVRIGVTRVALAGGMGMIVVLFVVLMWRRRVVRYVLIAIVGAGGLFILMPGRGHDVAALQAAYVQALERYDGTTYVWGGENGRGIDCSGLVRAAMIDAYYGEGLRTLNPGLVREGIWLWWKDIAAKDMPSGYDGRMVVISREKSIREMEAEALAPGDAAVMWGGSHVIAYLGGEEWIEADPEKGRVLKWHVAENAARADAPMQIVRWKCLTN